MLVVDRKYLKQDFPNLIQFIQAKHVMGPEIEQELYVNNKPVVGLCTQRGYFVMFGPYFIQYFMDHQILDVEEKKIGRAVASIIFYDNFLEYEADRIKTLSGSKDAKGLNLN